MEPETARKLLPLLKTGLRSQAVVDLLGAPDGMVWQYTLFYSSSLRVNFSGDSRVVGIVSDVARSAALQASAEGEPQESLVAAASADFKAQTYNRQKPAKTLIPILAPGFSLGQVADLLGPPNAKYWYYRLDRSGGSLSVGFDPADDVTQARIKTP
jgi:hypothetical protein